MPELSRFYGIVIRMYYNDHNPPHVHAEYGSSRVVIDVNTLAVIGGRLPATGNWTRNGMGDSASTRTAGCLAAGAKSGTR